MVKLAASILLVVLLAGCSGALGTLTSLGNPLPDVAANTQIGKENNQSLTFGVSESVGGNKQRDSIQTDRVENVEVNNGAPPWVWLLLLIGWLIDSPQTIIRNLFKRKRNG